MSMKARYKDGRNIDYPVPVGTKSGDPVILGEEKLPAIANIDRQSDGTASVTRTGSHLLTVKAANAGGNSAVAVGDTIYFDPNLTPKLSKIPTAPASKFGMALTTLTSGATGEVEVLLFEA
jgi:predicted RecA/RadA family phage recombinase